MIVCLVSGVRENGGEDKKGTKNGGENKKGIKNGGEDKKGTKNGGEDKKGTRKRTHCTSLVGFTFPALQSQLTRVKLLCKTMSGGRLEAWHFGSLSQIAIIVHSYRQLISSSFGDALVF